MQRMQECLLNKISYQDVKPATYKCEIVVKNEIKKLQAGG